MVEMSRRDLLRGTGAAAGMAALGVVGTFSIPSTASASPTGPPATYDPADYGTLVQGRDVTPAQRQANTDAIQGALDAAGAAGGGTVTIPNGTYALTGPDGGTCLALRHDNVTLTGAGRNKTHLLTRSDYVVVNGSVERAHGIKIFGTDDPAHPRANITICNLELDGGTGWTGDYNWPADPNTGKGWDITHKGIIVAQDQAVDKVLLDNLYVHSYSGEILYEGGLMAGDVTVRNSKIADTNASDFNLYGSRLLVENNEFAGPSRFWMELGARANQLGRPENQAIFRNNIFTKAVGAQGIAIAQGDLTTYSYTFEYNSFSDAPKGLFIFTGGVAGPVRIAHNTIDNVGGDRAKSGGAILDFEWGGNTVNNTHLDSNITFEHNSVQRAGSPIIDLTGSWDSEPMVTSELVIRANYFAGKSSTRPGDTDSILYGADTSWYLGTPQPVEYHGVSILRNTFCNVAVPKMIGPINAGSRPLFAGNSYKNVADPEGSGTFTITESSAKVTPQSDEMRIITTVAGQSPTFETSQYPDGTIVRVTGGSSTDPVRFTPNASTYDVQNTQTLNGSSKQLHFKFSATTGKWVQTA